MRRRQRDRGATLILLTLMLLAIIALAALAIDLNTAQRTQKQLQVIADAASVSSGVKLPDQTDASVTAMQIAKANGASSVNVVYPNPGEVKVSLQKTNSYFFARFFGVNDKVVAAGATAVSRGGKIVPIAIRDVARTPGKQFVLSLKRLAGNTLASGDFVAFSLGGAGVANYISRLENSYGGDYPKGANKNTEGDPTLEVATNTGLVVDPGTGKAVFQQAAGAPWFDNGMNYAYPNYPEGDPRIVMVARIVQPAKGSSKVTVNRFGSAYLRNYAVVAGTGQLTLVWLGDFTAVAGNPNRGWFQSKGLTRITK